MSGPLPQHLYGFAEAIQHRSVQSQRVKHETTKAPRARLQNGYIFAPYLTQCVRESKTK